MKLKEVYATSAKRVKWAQEAGTMDLLSSDMWVLAFSF